MDGVIRGEKAHDYDKQTFSNRSSNKIKQNSFVKRNIKEGAIVADLCCGSGVSIDFLREKSRKVYGIDASREMIEICKKRFAKCKNIELIACDVKNTPLKESSCDYILIRMGLHHIKDKKAVIDESYRILKKGGRLLIIDKFSKYNAFVTLPYDFCRNIRRGYGVLGHHYLSIDRLIGMTKGKFNVISCDSHQNAIYSKANLVLEKA